jgi:hypothetical protein
MTGLNNFGSAYTADLYYGDTTDNSTLRHQRINLGYNSWTDNGFNYLASEFTGAVITYYNKGEIIGEEQYEFDEENNKIIEEIRKDLQKTKKEYAKKAVYRLTDVEVDLSNRQLFINKSFSDGHTETVDVTTDVLNELKNGVKRTVYLSSYVLDFCSEQDPTIFDGWEVVVTDETADVGLTELPKNLDGYKDETNEEYIQRIKNRTEEIRQNEGAAVRDAERNDEIDELLRSI